MNWISTGKVFTETVKLGILIFIMTDNSDNFMVGDISISPQHNTITKDGHVCRLQPKAMAVLHYLAKYSDRVINNDELLDQVWGYNHYPTTRTVDTHILQLRQKLPGIEIETLRGVGYRMKP